MALKIISKLEVSPVIEPVAEPQKVLVQTPTSNVEAMTMEYIELYRKYTYFEVKDMVKRMDDIRKQLQTVANETMDDKKPAIFTCAEGEVEFSERGTKTEVPNPLLLVKVLLDKFGPEATATAVDIALGPLRKLLSEHELKNYLTEVPGGRTLKSVRPIG
jgi:hypothetical protein